MATALQSFRLPARSCRCITRTPRIVSKPIGRQREFSTATPLLDDSKRKVTSLVDMPRPYIPPIDKNSPMWDVRPEKHEQYKESLKRVGRYSKDDEIIREAAEEEFVEAPREAGVFNLYESTTKRKKKLKDTFLNMGDPEPFEDENFEFEADTHEDITTMGLGELEHHREMRHYARLAAWEMPLLSKFAKPYVPPTADMPLRFRYTTYLGEQHPAEKKVVVEFCTQDIRDMTHVQRLKLIKLAGVRHNPETDLVKMSCEMFPSQAQNKRYLGDIVEKMIKEAKDPKDTFEDVPVDIRHHRFKPKPQFPEGWKMTDKRRAELAQLREKAELKDQTLALTGSLVNGIKQIEAAFAKGPVSTPFHEMVMAGKGGKRIAMKR